MGRANERGTLSLGVKLCFVPPISYSSPVPRRRQCGGIFIPFQQKLRTLREKAMEEAIRLGGYRTQPLGRDRHGRYYYRFPGDPRRVFVGAASRDPSDGGEEFGIKDGPVETSILLRQDHVTEDLMVYENDGDLDALIGWLNKSGQREGPLQAALLRAFPPGQPAGAGAGEGGTGAATQKEEGKDDEGRLEKAVNHGTVDGGADPLLDDDGDVKMIDGGQGSTDATKPEEVTSDVAAPAVGTDGGARHRKGGRRGEDKGVLAKPTRNQELPRLLEEGLVELRMSLNPPGASNNVLLPASEAVVEFDNDGEVDEVRAGAGIRLPLRWDRLPTLTSINTGRRDTWGRRTSQAKQHK